MPAMIVNTYKGCMAIETPNFVSVVLKLREFIQHILAYLLQNFMFIICYISLTEVRLLKILILSMKIQCKNLPGWLSFEKSKF